MRYRIHFEPVDIENKTMEEIDHEWIVMKAWISSQLGDKVVESIPDLRKIVPIDKDGFPIQLGGETNEK